MERGYPIMETIMKRRQNSNWKTKFPLLRAKNAVLKTKTNRMKERYEYECKVR
jgi:hypothetical protein